jgi:serine phosphatase RsbU (regulator of sigma subunit)
VISTETIPGGPHRLRRAGTVAALCSLLSMICIPAATARSDRERGSNEAPRSGAETGSPRKDRGEAPAESAAPPAQTPPPPAKTERRSKRSSTEATGEGGQATSGSSAPPASAPAARRGSPGSGRDQGAGHSGTGRSGQGTGHQDQGTTGPARDRRKGASDTTPATTGATGRTKAAAKSGAEGSGTGEGRRSQERAHGPNGSHVVKGKAKKVEAARPTTLSSEPTGSSSSTSAPTVVSAAPATTTTTTAAATAAPVGSTSVATAALATGPALRVSRSAAQAQGTRAAAGKARPRSATTKPGTRVKAAPAALAVSVGATTALSAAHRGVSTHVKPAGKGARPGRTSPLVTTITRIVGVVPTPIKIVIALLVALALAMAARTRLAARRARRLEEQRGELLEDVGLLQAALLPVTPERLGPVGTSVAYRPAEGPGAGGDFYDVFALEDGKIAVIVGDVSGHGRKALPHTALMRFTLRAYLEAGLSPRGAVQTAGAVLDHQLGGSFATVVVATYNPRERLLVYAGAGHPPPLVRGVGPEDRPLEPVTVSSSPPVGVGMATGTRQSVISVPGACQICFFTDGVTEARVGGDLYGVERLGGALADLGPQATAAEVLDRVAQSTDRRPDDMAACLLRVEGGRDLPRLLTEELELDREQAMSERTERFLLDCGVTPGQAAEVMRAASIASERSGSVVLELHHHEEGAPTVSLQQDNLTYLQTHHASRQADLRVSV